MWMRLAAVRLRRALIAAVDHYGVNAAAHSFPSSAWEQVTPKLCFSKRR